ncbi:MAG: SpoIIE family protein phosphatase [Salinivirgaceae bacterium]
MTKTNFFTVLLLFLSVLLASKGLFAQINADGIPFIQNYAPDAYGADEANWSVTQDHRGIMYFGNLESILEYDGANWTKIPVPGQKYIYSLATGKDDMVYVGGVDDFGRLISDSVGSMQYQSLTKTLDSAIRIGRVFKTFAYQNEIYFCDFSHVFRYNIDTEIIQVIKLDKDNFLTFLVNGKLYTSNYRKGLMVVEDGEVDSLPGGEFFKEKDVFSIEKWGKDTLLISARGHDLTLYNVKTGAAVPFKFNNVAEETNRRLKDAWIYAGTKVDDNHFAYGTYSNGLYIINKTGEIKVHLNEDNGLQHNLVTNLYFPENESGVLWLTLNNGISSVNINSPIRRFSKESGLEGALNGIAKFKDDYYFASNFGVYKMVTSKNNPVVFEPISGLAGETVYGLLRYNAPDGTDHLLIASGIDAYVVRNSVADTLGVNTESTYLLPSQIHPERVYVATKQGIKILEYANETFGVTSGYRGLNQFVTQIVEDEKGDLWSKTLSDIQHISSDGELLQIPDAIKDRKGAFLGFNQNVFFADDESVFKYNHKKKDFEHYVPFEELFYSKGKVLHKLFQLNDSMALAHYMVQDKRGSEVIKIVDGKWSVVSPAWKLLPSMSVNAGYCDYPYSFLGGQDGLFVKNTTRKKNFESAYGTYIRNITIGTDSVVYEGAPGFLKESLSDSVNVFAGRSYIDYSLNNITFNFAAPFFERESDLRYNSMLEGFDKNWSGWQTEGSRIYTNLKEGVYQFHVKSINAYGVESIETVYEFEILPPWYRTWWAYLIYLVVAFFIIRISIGLYTRKLQEDKRRLERIVKERTAEIVEKNKKIEHQNIAITDSIRYAKRIQTAVLPDKQTSDMFEYFVYFKPKDIVSGDFYWIYHFEKFKRLIVVAADCTGHGVPGAFMSMLGTSFLNEIVAKVDTSHSEDILNLLRENVIRTLSQGNKEGDDEGQKDGMDMALASINLETKLLEFSGANNPLILIRDNELVDYKPDKMPIGAYIKQNIPFSRKEIQLQKGDVFYMFSDGFVDQFGGPQGRKYMKKRFKEYLLAIHNEPMDVQKQKLNEEMFHWMDGVEQIDDQIVIGMRLVK